MYADMLHVVVKCMPICSMLWSNVCRYAACCGQMGADMQHVVVKWVPICSFDPSFLQIASPGYLQEGKTLRGRAKLKFEE